MTFSADLAINRIRVPSGDDVAPTGDPRMDLASRVAAAPLALPDALRLMAERALRLMGAVGTRIVVAPEVRVIASAGAIWCDDRIHEDERGLYDLVLRERRPRVVHLSLAGRRVYACAAVPLIADDVAIGVLLAADARAEPFTDVEVEQLVWLADLGALTIRNAQLVGRAERSAAEARALAEIIQNINQSLELDRVFDLVARHAMALLGGNGARLGMLDGDHFVLVASAGVSNVEVGSCLPVEGTIGGACIRRGHAIHARLDDGSAHWGSAARLPPGCRAGVCAPLLVGERPLGAILVFSGEDRHFDAEDERLLSALADHAAIAIENARLYRASVRTMRHASVLATAARSLALNVAPTATYEDISRIARAALGADGVAVYLADPDSGRVEVAYGEGIGAAIVPTLIVPTFWDSTAGHAVRSGEALFVSRLADLPDEPIVRAIMEQGVSSVVMLPLGVEGRTRGLLVLRFRNVQDFNPDRRSLLLDYATQVAVAVRNARLFDDLGRRVTQLTAIAQLQQAIAAAVSPREVHEELYKAVSAVVDAPCFTLLRFCEERRVFVPELVMSDGQRVRTDHFPRVPLGDGPTSQAFRSRKPNVTARGDRGWTGVAYEMKSEREVAVVLSAPIVHGDRVLGVLQAQSYRADAYDESAVDLTMLIAQQAATAMVNAMAFEAERREREQAEAAAAIARVALRARSVKDAAAEILAIVRRTVNVSGMALGAIAEDGAVRCVASIGTLAVEPDDVMTQSSAAPNVAVPLSAAGRLIGIVRASPTPGTVLPARDAAALSRLAPPIALALDSMILRAEERRVAEQLRQSEKLVALGELVAGVAHEVNNPLTGISAMTQLLLEEPLDAEQLESLRLIKREADRAVAVIRDLLIFARKTGPRIVRVDLNELIDQTLRLRTYGLRSAGVQTELDLAPELAEVDGDDRQLQQVLLNLVMNAEYAMTGMECRVLTLRTSNQPGWVIVEITDTGAGMTPEVQKRIFEPFFTTKPEGRGTGLGLSVSYGIVQTHGGTLTVHTAPGAGATFRISLPVAGTGPSSSQRLS